MPPPPKPSPSAGSGPPASLAALQDAAARDPDDAYVQLELGKYYLSAGQAEQAEHAFRRAGRLARGSPQPRLGLAASLLARGKRDEARAELRKLLQEFPGNADAWFNLGNLYRAEGQLDDAARCYRKVLSVRAADESACLNLAVALTQGDRFDAAETELRNFIDAFGPTADLLNNLGQVLRYQRKFAAAEETFRRVLKLDADHGGAQLNYAITLRQAGNTGAAERILRTMIVADPGNSEAHFQLSTVLLIEGRFEEGWKEYAWRDTYRSSRYSATRVPLLEELRNKSVVVKEEQGLGDVLFFLRFLERLSDVAGSVAVQMSPRLQKVLPGIPRPSNPGATETIEVMAGDLPAITKTTIVAPVPLAADPALVSALSKRLAALGPAPYFAVTWEAGTRLRDSKKPGAELHKRIEPRTLAQAFNGVEGTLISIQRNPVAADLAEFRGALAGRPVHDLGDINPELDQAVALLSLLDSYVGVSNTNMHLLAGLGKQAEVLVPAPPDWRWMLSGDSSPWFPGFRAYRQTVDLSWETAIRSLRERLLARARK